MMLRDEAHMEPSLAFDISSKIRQGWLADGTIEKERTLLAHPDLPAWFVPYIEKVHYMTSKAATIGILQIALGFMWYKIHYPKAFDE